MLDVSLWGALVAGILSFVSPCVLPIVPPYLAWLAGLSFEELQASETLSGRSRKIVMAAVAFVLGFSTVFIMLGATASIFGQAMREALAWSIRIGPLDINVLAAVAGLVILVMGLHFLGVFRIGLLYREARVQVDRKPAGLVGAYVIGLAFAFGWTPCVGPVLAAILFVAGTEDTAARGAMLLGAYSLGIGVPFVLAAVFASRFIGAAQRFKRHMHKVEMAMGGLLVITGILFITGQMSRIAQWLIDTFPAFQTIG
ncbi:MAG: cytochrome C biogenesis protein [Phyllobacteriaceae bacterium]|uniref:cytochrome c biogenesis CcdA family protein n=1 Tax=Zhengella sedimenti TaxID=3390035 RepID=UPI000C65800A|nr:cytochrome C biogenesis protein [Phyllobacteriaceae bacterium]MBA92472.1 cytochrome C biogenesis protein [Phyllobacteriaceae bacterium]